MSDTERTERTEETTTTETHEAEILPAPGEVAPEQPELEPDEDGKGDDEGKGDDDDDGGPASE